MAEFFSPQATQFPDFKGVEPKEVLKENFAYRIFVIEDFSNKAKKGDRIKAYFRYESGSPFHISLCYVEGVLISCDEKSFLLKEVKTVHFFNEENFKALPLSTMHISFVDEERYIYKIYYSRQEGSKSESEKIMHIQV